MPWKRKSLTRTSLGLAVAAIALVALSASLFLAMSRLEGVHLALLLSAEAAFLLSPACALAGFIFGIAALRREGGWRPAAAAVLSAVLLVGMGWELVSVMMSAVAGA